MVETSVVESVVPEDIDRMTFAAPTNIQTAMIVNTLTDLTLASPAPVQISSTDLKAREEELGGSGP